MGYLENFKVVDEVAIVTGGSKGLGRAMAFGLAECGAKVVVASRTVSLIEETANEIIKKGGQAIAVPVDVKNPQSIEQMVDQVMEQYRPGGYSDQQCGHCPDEKNHGNRYRRLERCIEY